MPRLSDSPRTFLKCLPHRGEAACCRVRLRPASSNISKWGVRRLLFWERLRGSAARAQDEARHRSASHGKSWSAANPRLFPARKVSIYGFSPVWRPPATKTSQS